MRAHRIHKTYPNEALTRASDIVSDAGYCAIEDGSPSAPGWNRERLIEQFRRIDGSTRSEAEREIAALELSFGSANANVFGKAARDVNPDRRPEESRKK